MAELADAPDLGSGVYDVKVQVLFGAPKIQREQSSLCIFASRRREASASGKRKYKEEAIKCHERVLIQNATRREMYAEWRRGVQVLFGAPKIQREQSSLCIFVSKRREALVNIQHFFAKYVVLLIDKRAHL